MARDLKYGKVEFERGSIADDELVFALRAQDPHAPEAIRQYALLCVTAGAPAVHVQAVLDAAGMFERWQRENPERVKANPGLPKDVPPGTSELVTP
jgi:hypothetical protein